MAWEVQASSAVPTTVSRLRALRGGDQREHLQGLQGHLGADPAVHREHIGSRHQRPRSQALVPLATTPVSGIIGLMPAGVAASMFTHDGRALIGLIAAAALIPHVDRLTAHPPGSPAGHAGSCAVTLDSS